METLSTPRLERLPKLVHQKLYKTRMTRGATVREIYQNRVSRNNTVLIPLEVFDACAVPDDGLDSYENGFIVLIDPQWYFGTSKVDELLASRGLLLGTNALLLFQRRRDWKTYSLDDGATFGAGHTFVPATARQGSLGGTYIARIHSTTSSSNSDSIIKGFNSKNLRGAGIRVYEYCSSEGLDRTQLQLEALIWLCHDSASALVQSGMTGVGAENRMKDVLERAEQSDLLDYDRLRQVRMIDSQNNTICPLCLERLSALDFLKRGEQAEGRETWDLTITELSLFHIDELRVGKLQHKVYNLGWGHNFCNVVVKDAGIVPTLRWMKRVLDSNGNSDSAIRAVESLVEEGSR